MQYVVFDTAISTVSKKRVVNLSYQWNEDHLPALCTNHNITVGSLWNEER
jgi:hypothetical protein